MALPWKLHGDGKSVAQDAIVLPEERLGWARTIGFGAQHVVAMFGATFLVPLITGFPPTATLFFSGLGTMLFLLLTGNRLPSYLGSSFAFLAPIAVATAGYEYGDVAGLARASFAIIAMGVLVALVGVIVQRFGIGWVNALMPPVVMGSVVALIGFNLAPAVKNNWFGNPAANPDVNQGLHSTAALITIGSILLITVLFRGLIGRLSIVLGMVVGYIAAALMGIVDFEAVKSAAWVGLPEFHLPANPFADPSLWGLLPAFLPVVLVLIAENVGHVKSVGLMINRDLDPVTGRALLADGLSTILAGFGGGSATTTYGENIGVMAATRVYSTAAYWVAGIIAMLLSFSPKVGALIFSVPAGVLGGVTVALYGLIGLIGVKIWIDNKVDFSKPINQFTAAIALIVGIADFSMQLGDVMFNGIALGTIAAVVVYHLMRLVARARGTATDTAIIR
ncbi:putative pyrimidine permease RutG [Leucobacter aridicollis]|uniref:NCS2 family nucleobase:cation symporter-2 n=1 Tax=Leucobacter aridicollis TaxID=283878 RepID=A0A852R284_9MICO|nr:solute carrier family 23 protein [Leucobacter aridicollis]MBL3681258.1 nitrate reductase [Leucobacter aridicollis]MCS3427397.1 NCS2 family nucleobase:cation symporter-2 [Leucobacter aridicollis]NYD27721.1 NCS2 family nucleobase:cation symporter-2 [Leucobacter aridicollis]RKQ84455.1 NCS2 family nucleobase:cation symporter-2 [Mycolicibacterium mucogenicum 261Sha1.1M5]